MSLSHSAISGNTQPVPESDLATDREMQTEARNALDEILRTMQNILQGKLRRAAEAANISKQYEAIKDVYTHFLPLENLRRQKVAFVEADAAVYAGFVFQSTDIAKGKVAIPIDSALQHAFAEFHDTMVERHPWYNDFLEQVAEERNQMNKFVHGRLGATSNHVFACTSFEGST